MPKRSFAILAGQDAWPNVHAMLAHRAQMKRQAGAVALAFCAASPALAHPHIFIDTTIEVLLDDQNRAIAVRIGWTYDSLYSLSIIADRGLDADWDGALTDAEAKAPIDLLKQRLQRLDEHPQVRRRDAYDVLLLE